jgi:hypothetical protein
MSDSVQEFHDFEAHLTGLFDAPPALADADLFAVSVMQRLDRAWLFRCLVIGGASLLGSLIAVNQLMTSNLIRKIQALSLGVDLHLLRDLTTYAGTHLVLPSWPIGGEGLWMSAGLAGLALVYALTQAIEEF